jgi:hypothetical protein
MKSALRRIGVGLFLFILFVGPIAQFDSHAQTDILKYAITAVPGNLQVNRMPGPNPPRSYQEQFTFTVKDPTRTDFAGTAPSCQTFDVEVIPVSGTNPAPIWLWSKGMVFCQVVTPVNIAAGKGWKKTVIWKFTTADVPDGKYRAIATFVPTGNKSATVEFEITSVQ